LIHPLLDRPQLLGTSRHITGAYSVSHLSWNGAAKTLAGQAETVAGEPYTLWVHVPSGMKIVRVQPPASQQVQGELLSVTFTGQSQPLQWKLAFQ
jgi:hypothetical protein